MLGAKILEQGLRSKDYRTKRKKKGAKMKDGDLLPLLLIYFVLILN